MKNDQNYMNLYTILFNEVNVLKERLNKLDKDNQDKQEKCLNDMLRIKERIDKQDKQDKQNEEFRQNTLDIIKRQSFIEGIDTIISDINLENEQLTIIKYNIRTKETTKEIIKLSK